MAMPCMAWLGPWGAASCLSRSRPAVEPTGYDRAGRPDIRLPSAGPSLSVLTASNPYVPTRSFLSGFARSFDRLPAVSPFSYVPATSQAPYRLRSRLRSSQGGRLRGFDGGFGGPGFGAGNPTMAKGYGQSPSAMLCKALHCYAWHCYAMQSVERAGAEWGDEAPYTLGRPEGGGSAPTPESAGIRLLLGGTSPQPPSPPSAQISPHGVEGGPVGRVDAQDLPEGLLRISLHLS